MSTLMAPAPSSPAADLVQAARGVLAAHDALEASNARESFRTDSHGLPVDRARWVQWYELDYKPTYDAWSATMDRLAAVIGPEFPGRHPWAFRPACERIIAEASTSASAASLLIGGIPRMGKASPLWLRTAEALADGEGGGSR